MTIVAQVEEKIFKQFDGESSGHDWYHIMRVLEMARFIQSKEGGDLQLVELAALLHDISDYKLNGGILDEGGNVAFDLLLELGANKERADKVKYIVDNISYKGANTKVEMDSLEGRIVQDADRLDAIGAIGIARTFAYGGNKNQAMYDPSLKVKLHDSFESYANSSTSTIHHFYEKLLLLKDRLNTETAKQIGAQRHALIEEYLKQFHIEWNFKAD